MPILVAVWPDMSNFVICPVPLLVTPPQNSGPCNTVNCLGHFKNVFDDDDVDDDLYAKPPSSKHEEAAAELWESMCELSFVYLVTAHVY